MNKYHYSKRFIFARFLKVFKNLNFYKFSVAFFLILVGIILIQYENFLEIASIISGTGFALFISVIFDYFSEMDRVKKMQISFIDELGADIEKTRFHKFSKQFEDEIISRILSLNARSRPIFLRSMGSIGVLKMIEELTGNQIIIEDSNKFVLKPLIDLSYSCIWGKYGEKINESMKKALYAIYWSLHNNSHLEETFLKEINRHFKSYLSSYSKFTSPDEFISLYSKIAIKCIYHNGFSRGRPHFKEKRVLYVFNGNEKGVYLAIKGLQEMADIFPEKRTIIEREINSIKKKLEKYKKIKKFKL